MGVYIGFPKGRYMKARMGLGLPPKHVDEREEKVYTRGYTNVERQSARQTSAKRDTIATKTVRNIGAAIGL